MAFALYRNLGSYLSTENASVRLSDTVYPNYSVIVNSPVIMASINKESNKVYLSEPVVFTIKHLQVRKCFLFKNSKNCHYVSQNFKQTSYHEKESWWHGVEISCEILYSFQVCKEWIDMPCTVPCLRSSMLKDLQNDFYTTMF